MKIVIPMSGFGERFRAVGYDVPKALIPVDGKAMIAHVIDMFPGDHDFVFICNEEHIRTTEMKNIIERHCPSGVIRSIPPHKLGPVYAVYQAFDLIDDDEPVIINYCDFSCHWEFSSFLNYVQSHDLDGCIPAYRGFHPHSLGSTNYAYIKLVDNCVQEIQEKQPFTSNKMDEYASSGTYYFSKGNFIKKYFTLCMSQGLSIGSEFYCSLPYNLMIESGSNVGIYEIEYFMQWGTPQDLHEYNYYSGLFSSLVYTRDSIAHSDCYCLLPMAGIGSRFQNEGYICPKPLLPISKKPMFAQAIFSLPQFAELHVCALESHSSEFNISSIIDNYFPNSKITLLPNSLSGQALTCLYSLNTQPFPNQDIPLVISACDHSILYCNDTYNTLLNDFSVDVIVWAIKSYPFASKSPYMYGWLSLDEDNNILSASVKTPLSDPSLDPLIIGTFTFKSQDIFINSVNSMIQRNGLVNEEFYIDNCINDAIRLGYRCKVFFVDHFISWGTPNEYRTFQYWQSCFDKWPSHSYRLSNDSWFVNHISSEHKSSL